MISIGTIAASGKGTAPIPTAMEITAAGYLDSIGVYALTGTENGRNTYEFSGDVAYKMYWTDAWPETGGFAWVVLRGANRVLYWTAEDVTYPSDATLGSWALGSTGQVPTPTIVAVY